MKADLNLTLLSLATPGAYYLSPYRNPPERFTVTTERDGRFALSPLCQGTYSLKVVAEGKARVDLRATIASDQKPVTVDPVLDQGTRSSEWYKMNKADRYLARRSFPRRGSTARTARVYDGIVTQAGPK